VRETPAVGGRFPEVVSTPSATTVTSGESNVYARAPVPTIDADTRTMCLRVGLLGVASTRVAVLHEVVTYSSANTAADIVGSVGPKFSPLSVMVRALPVAAKLVAEPRERSALPESAVAKGASNVNHPTLVLGPVPVTPWMVMVALSPFVVVASIAALATESPQATVVGDVHDVVPQSVPVPPPPNPTEAVSSREKKLAP
jgi:hypothetical protein